MILFFRIVNDTDKSRRVIQCKQNKSKEEEEEEEKKKKRKEVDFSLSFNEIYR